MKNFLGFPFIRFHARRIFFSAGENLKFSYITTVDRGLNKASGHQQNFTYHRRNKMNAILSSEEIHSYASAMGKIIFIFGMLFFSETYSQNQNLIFRNITSADGLSQGHGLAICKDHKGFMWFGTQDGLNKYDGYKIIVYEKDPGDSNSLSNNFINTIYEDVDDNLWIGTADGLNRYDEATDTFIRYMHDSANNESISNNHINVIVEDKNALWIGTKNGLNRLDKKTKVFTCYKYDKDDPQSLSDDFIVSLAEDSKGNFWVGTETQGLNLFDRKTTTSVHFKHHSDVPESISNNRVTSIVEDSKGKFWVATDGGINLFNRDNGTFKHYIHDNRDRKSIGSNIIYTMLEDSKGNLWVGTMNSGLNLYNRETDDFTHYTHDQINKNSISNNTPSVIYEDDNGTLWVGVHRGGINYFHPYKEKFKSYQQELNENSLSSNNIKSMYEDRQGTLWIGTDGGGLNSFDQKTNIFTRHRHHANDPHSIASDVVLSIYEDSYGNLWIGTLLTGLDLFDRKNNRFIHYKTYREGKRYLPNFDIWSIFEDDRKNLWVGTSRGIGLLDRVNHTITSFDFDSKSPYYDRVQCIYQDTNKNLWVGTYRNGLLRFNAETKHFTPETFGKDSPSNVNDAMINVIHEDEFGNLWIGTYGGLLVWNIHTKAFRIYKKNDGLLNEVIKSILEDSQGNIWMSTLTGLSKFNPKTKIFKNYPATDGLLDNEFTQNASLKTKAGELFFGGINGFNSFYPDSLKDNKLIPPVFLTSFEIFNKPVAIGKGSPLTQHINKLKTITLSYKQSVFTFEFAALNYQLPKKNQYAYKLEGFDKSWNYVGNQRKATYTNLDPGEYTFLVKASNNDGLWNEQGTSIKVIVTPPFWLTLWFKILAISCIAGGSSAFYFLRVNTIKRQKRKLEDQVKERTEQLVLLTEEEKNARQEAEQANRAKSIFLATMSHEIRTPMNGVLGMAALLAETSLTSEQRDYTHTIQNSGEALLGVINDILDFSKIESGKMELENNDFNLRDCIEEVLDVFAVTASRSQLDLIYEIDNNVPSQIIGDSLRLRQVLLNLVSNAIKFTHQGEIFLSVQLEKMLGDDLYLKFEVRDTGIGIPKDKLQRLFKAFSQVDSSTTRKYGGTGLGLVISEKLIALMGGEINVESEPGTGTKFMFTVQVKSSHQATKTYVHMNVIGLEGKRILVTDDNETNRTILKNQLEQWKLVPVMARSGKEAIDILKDINQNFDLVLTDMQMPEMDGMELARQIRKQYSALPIILLSSVGERSTEHNELFASVLTKPVKQATLHKHIVAQLTRNQRSLTEDAEVTKKLSVDFAKQYPLHILIAEDNLTNQKLAERVLSKLGYVTEMVSNGKEAVDAQHLHHYDLILMDIQMPEMDGLEATRTIRLQAGPHPVIIAMTANAMQGDRETCLQAGMDDYISKPIKLEVLIKLLEKWATKKIMQKKIA